MFEFDTTAALDVDQDSIEEGGLRFPLIQFKGGSQAMTGIDGIRWRGGFFIGDDALGGVNLAEFGWQADTFVTKQGKKIAGWYSPILVHQLIARRRRWKGEDDVVFPWAQFQEAKDNGKMRGHQQAIVIVKGLEQFGPFVFTLSGHQQMAYNGDKQYAPTGALKRFRETVLARANEITKEGTPKGEQAPKWDYYGFWMPVAASTDAKGDPYFYEVGVKEKSQTVLPVAIAMPEPPAKKSDLIKYLPLPEKPSDIDLNKYFVGREQLGAARKVLDTLKAEGWLTAWDGTHSGHPAEPITQVNKMPVSSLADEAGV